jgi:hypothetical protein
VSSAAITQFLQYLILAGSGVTVFRLSTTGLFRHYRVFFWFFLFRIPNSIWPLFLSVDSSSYFILWITTTPIAATFYILVTMEVYRLILEKHRGVYTLGRWAMQISTLVAVITSILILLPHFTPSIPQRSRLLGYGVAMYRGVDASVLIFLLLMLLFLTRYPVTLSRNVAVHYVLFSIYFASSTITSLLRGIWGIVINTQVNLILLGSSALCTLAWAIFLTPKGEEVRARASVPFCKEYEKRVLRQLDTLNSTLIKISRN